MRLRMNVKGCRLAYSCNAQLRRMQQAGCQAGVATQRFGQSDVHKRAEASTGFRARRGGGGGDTTEGQAKKSDVGPEGQNGGTLRMKNRGGSRNQKDVGVMQHHRRQCRRGVAGPAGGHLRLVASASTAPHRALGSTATPDGHLAEASARHSTGCTVCLFQAKADRFGRFASQDDMEEGDCGKAPSGCLSRPRRHIHPHGRHVSMLAGLPCQRHRISRLSALCTR